MKPGQETGRMVRVPLKIVVQLTQWSSSLPSVLCNALTGMHFNWVYLQIPQTILDTTRTTKVSWHKHSPDAECFRKLPVSAGGFSCEYGSYSSKCTCTVTACYLATRQLHVHCVACSRGLALFRKARILFLIGFSFQLWDGVSLSWSGTCEVPACFLSAEIIRMHPHTWPKRWLYDMTLYLWPKWW